MKGQFALYAEKILESKDYYRAYQERKINSMQFCEAMLADTSLENVEGFYKGNLKRIASMPPDEIIPTETIIGYLVKNNIISSCDNMYDGFDEYRKYIRKNYNHGEFLTFIYPEDERLLYAVSQIMQPKTAIVAGSYFGYFAIWAMKTIHTNGGTAVLSDINGEVCKLAQENFGKLGYGNNVKIYAEDAEKVLSMHTEPVDMLVLDATGRHDDPRPEYRGKRIYGALLKAAKHLLKKGSVIVIHNMEPEHPEMKELVDGLQAINALGTNYDTFNGLGVYIIK